MRTGQQWSISEGTEWILRVMLGKVSGKGDDSKSCNFCASSGPSLRGGRANASCVPCPPPPTPASLHVPAALVTRALLARHELPLIRYPARHTLLTPPISRLQTTLSRSWGSGPACSMILQRRIAFWCRGLPPFPVCALECGCVDRASRQAPLWLWGPLAARWGSG